jgi:hypothetical protein
MPDLPIITLRLDGRTVLSRALDLGAFTLEAVLDQPARVVKVELLVDHVVPLPSPDNRPVSLLLQSIRLQSTQ